MKEEHTEKIPTENPKKYLFKSLCSLLLLIVGVFSFMLVWEPTVSNAATVFLIMGYFTIIVSILFAVRVIDKSIQYLKIKTDVFAIIALAIASIVIIGIMIIIINLFG